MTVSAGKAETDDFHLSKNDAPGYLPSFTNLRGREHNVKLNFVRCVGWRGGMAFPWIPPEH